MDWIILNSGIPNLLKNINPLSHLSKQIHKNDGFSTLSSILPSFFSALFFGLYSDFKEFRQYAKLVRIAEIDIFPVLIAYLSCCRCPKIVSLIGGVKLASSKKGMSDFLTSSAVWPVLVACCWL